MKLRITFAILFMVFLLPFIFAEPFNTGSLVITRKSTQDGSLKALVLNLNSGTLINTNKQRFILSKDVLDEVNELISKLDLSEGNLDYRDSSLQSSYVYFMANTQYGKSVVWQDGAEGNNQVLTTIESYFETYARLRDNIKV